MGIDLNSKQYQADRNTFNANHKASGNASFPAMRTAELEAAAKSGNTYARQQLLNERRADMAVTGDVGEAANLEGEAWGKTGDTLEHLSDATTMGAHRNLRDAWDQSVDGHYVDSGKSMLKAGGKVLASTAKSWACDKIVTGVIGKTGSLVAGVSQATLRNLAQFASKNADEIWSVPGMTQDLLSPALEGALNATH